LNVQNAKVKKSNRFLKESAAPWVQRVGNQAAAVEAAEVAAGVINKV
jgi:hypothetical protein